MERTILQFGTSRFLQAHVDLFVGEALSPGPGQGPITVVQTTGSPERAGRVAAFNAGRYPIRLRGLRNDQVVDRTIEVCSVSRGLSTATDWREIERSFVEDTRIVVSNTGERGYDLDASDRLDGAVPRSFPGKLLRLLLARHRAGAAPLVLYPCELVGSNGDTLRDIVVTLAEAWSLDTTFRTWLRLDCRWVNSLVDRIVSAPIEPVGAIAEPYALWAIEAQPGLPLPCRHEDVVVTDRLADYERHKLHILNLGHTVLVELWRRRRSPDAMMVRDAMQDTSMRRELESVLDEEVLPTFDALGIGVAARAYRASVIERFSNPFLDHRLSEIAINHGVKLQRRVRPLIDLADHYGPDIRQSRLRSIMAI